MSAYENKSFNIFLELCGFSILSHRMLINGSITRLVIVHGMMEYH